MRIARLSYMLVFVGILSRPSLAGDLLVVNVAGDPAIPQNVLRFDKSTGAFEGVFAIHPRNTPQGIALGSDGLLYVGSTFTGEIFRYDGTTGAFVDLFAVEPAAISTRNIAFGPDGNLYMVDSMDAFGPGGVIRFDGATGGSLGYFVAIGSGGIQNPSDLLFGQDENLYVSSYNSHQVLRYDGTTGASLGVFLQMAPNEYPTGMTLGPDGHLYVSTGDVTNSVIRVNATTGVVIDVFVTPGSGGLTFPVGIVFGPDGNLYVASHLSAEVLRYDGATGASLGAFVSAGSGGLTRPNFMIFMNDPPVANAGADQEVECTSPAGAFVTLNGSPPPIPTETPSRFSGASRPESSSTLRAAPRRRLRSRSVLRSQPSRCLTGREA